MQLRPSLKWLALTATIGMIVLILGGALVTKTESGDGCGTSWPLCHDQIIPDEITMETVFEAMHRITTGVVAIIVIVLAYLCWKEIGHYRETKFLVVLGIVFLILQSLIGAATVLWDQSDFFLALHFGISLISFAAIFLLTLFIFELDKKWNTRNFHYDNRYKFHTIGITIFSFIVIYSGALVRHVDASMICPDWPFCRNDQIGLPMNFYEWVQMGHRFLAGLLFLWIIYMFIQVFRHYRANRVIYYGWLLNAALITMQVISGAFVIFSGLNLYISLLHALFITCLFGVLSYMVLLIYRNQQTPVTLYVNERTSTSEEQASIS